MLCKVIVCDLPGGDASTRRLGSLEDWDRQGAPAGEPEAAPDADADDADADDKTEDARGGASDDDADADDRGTKRRAGDDAEPPAEAKRRRRGNCVIC